MQQSDRGHIKTASQPHRHKIVGAQMMDDTIDNGKKQKPFVPL